MNIFILLSWNFIIEEFRKSLNVPYQERLSAAQAIPLTDVLATKTKEDSGTNAPAAKRQKATPAPSAPLRKQEPMDIVEEQEEIPVERHAYPPVRSDHFGQHPSQMHQQQQQQQQPPPQQAAPAKPADPRLRRVAAGDPR